MKENLLRKVESLLSEIPLETLEFACDLTWHSICNYCNIDSVPEGLLPIAAMLVKNLLQSARLSENQLQPAVKGVSRGDTSFTFASVEEQMAQIASANTFLLDYHAQLNAYRKMRK